MFYHRLQVVEYIFIAGSVVGCILAVASGQLIYAVVPLSISLLLNLINRLRFEQRIKRRLTNAIAQLHRQVLEDSHALHEQQLQDAIASLKAQLPEYFSPLDAIDSQPSDSSINQLRTQYVSLEQSLSSVVQYLNSSSLLERVEHLEKAIASATARTPGIHRQLANNWERRLEEMEQRLQSIESEDVQVPLTKAITEPSLFPGMVKPSDSPQGDEALAVDGSWFIVHSNEQDAPNIATASLSTMNHEQDGRGGFPPPLREDEASSPPFVESVPVESPSFSSPPPTWSPIHTLTGHSDWVRALAISPDGQTLASASFDKTIKLWQLSTGQLTHTCSEHSKGVLCVAISPDGQTLGSGSFDETIKLWRLDTGKLIHTLTGHTGSVRSLAISPNNQLLISGSFDKTIKLWELETGRLLGTLTNTEPVSAIALTADGQTLASGGVDGIITLWQLSAPDASVEPALRCTLTGNFSSVCSLAISPDSQLLAAGCTDGNVKLWQLDTVEPLNILQCHLGPVMSVVFSSEAQTLYSGGADGTIKIYVKQSQRTLHCRIYLNRWFSRGSNLGSIFPAGYLCASASRIGITVTEPDQPSPLRATDSTEYDYQ